MVPGAGESRGRFGSDLFPFFSRFCVLGFNFRALVQHALQEKGEVLPQIPHRLQPLCISLYITGISSNAEVQ